MPELRWILLGAGLLLLLLIYALGRRSGSSGSSDGRPSPRVEPRLDDAPKTAPDAVGDLAETVRKSRDSLGELAPDLEEDASQASAPKAEKVVILHVAARNGEEFAGATLIAALRAESLRFGRFGIFHRFLQQDASLLDANPVFGVANMVEPGVFDLDKASDERYRGVTMFLSLPGPTDPLAAFADMLATGRRLAATLGGDLLDQTGSTVSRQSASHLREEIINFQHGIKVGEVETRV